MFKILENFLSHSECDKYAQMIKDYSEDFETTREDFIAKYLGQTAGKTKKLLESCIGGVLFIDEVYALGPGKDEKDSFSKEAIDTLNVFLSENSDNFCCIIAGYEQDIKDCFFSVNKGLERRFQWIHRIDSYDSTDLSQIFFKLIDEIEWQTDCTPEFIRGIIDKNSKLFTSFGGDVENLVSKCKMTHALRIFSQEKPVKFLITNEDIIHAIELMKNHQLKTQEDNSYCRHMYM